MSKVVYGKYESGGDMVKHFTKKKHLNNLPIRYIMFKCKQWIPFREQLKKKQ